jgi:putative DNA primase/helicase
MIAPEIAAALGGASRSGAWWRCRCPVHGSRGPTLALRDCERGLFLKCFGGCHPRDVLAELRRLGLLGDAPHDRHHRPTPAIIRDDTARRIALARRTWDAAQNARGTPAEACLTVRGINIAPPPSLRSAPSLRRPDGTYGPAMLARIDNIEGELIGISRTWLRRGPDGDWRRRDRAMLGVAAGGAVRLAPAAETLMVGEGIETSLSAMQATAQAAWAALSTSGLVALALPAIVRTVIILADNDANGAGERAARMAAARWRGEGRVVKIAMPPEPGIDFNDVLLGRSYARITESRDVAA